MILDTFKEIKSQLQTGDLILHSSSHLTSLGTKMITQSEYTHVAMILIMKDADEILVYQSANQPCAVDYYDKTMKSGVQVNSLDEHVKNYEGKMWIRRLEIQRTPNMLSELEKFRKTVEGRSYEESFLEKSKSAIDFILPENKENLSSIFCSELIAEAYQSMGILQKNEEGGQSSNEYVPKDFAKDNDSKLHLQLGARLGEEILIKEREFKISHLT